MARKVSRGIAKKRKSKVRSSQKSRAKPISKKRTEASGKRSRKTPAKKKKAAKKKAPRTTSGRIAAKPANQPRARSARDAPATRQKLARGVARADAVPVAFDPNPTTDPNIPLPVEPVAEDLPVGRLDPRKFEEFCRDLVVLRPDAHSHRATLYGGPGHDQKGIDITSELAGGRWRVVQSKRYEEFKVADVRRAVEACEYEADEYYLAVSCRVGPAERDEIKKHSGWAIWDAENLSQFVSQLPPDKARQLVLKYFGRPWVASFLRIPSLSAFVSGEDYFRPFAGQSRLFHHSWSLIGRENHVAELERFVCGTEHRIALIAGSGGIGKTKLLHALHEKLRGSNPPAMFWLLEDVPLTAELAETLPLEACTIVVDDAHRRDDLGTILGLITQRPQHKLLIATRPHAVERLRSMVLRARIDSREIFEPAELKPLDLKQVEQLAREVLGAELEHHAHRLALITRDCPLVTVVGGTLLVERGIDPALLERDAEFRNVALARLREQLLRTSDVPIDQQRLGKLFDLIAALQPLRIDDDQSISAIAEAVEVVRSDVRRLIDLFTVRGGLIRRKNIVRITPDVLADHILSTACTSTDGSSTGFADEVFATFEKICPDRVLMNIAELDWRIRRSGPPRTNLLDGMWQKIEARFRDASSFDRYKMMTPLLERLGYYQPARVLGLMRYAIAHPVGASAEEEAVNRALRAQPLSYAHVMRQVPRVLYGVSYTIEFVQPVLDLLWELGRDDTRDLHSNADHPIRALKDIAGYDINKPFKVNEIAIPVTRSWLRARDAHAHGHSPLLLLECVLARADFSTRNYGNRIEFVPFSVPSEPVAALRRSALDIVIECANSSDLRAAGHGLDVLEKALKEPTAQFNQVISKEDLDQWAPEQLELMGRLEELGREAKLPLVHLRLREILSEHCSHSSFPEVKLKAVSISASIPETLQHALYRAVVSIDDFTWEPGSENTRSTARRQHGNDRRAEASRVAASFPQSFANPVAGHELLAQMFRDAETLRMSIEPDTFLQSLASANPDYAVRLSCVIVQDGASPLRRDLGSLIAGLQTQRGPEGRSIAEEMLRRNEPALLVTLAQSLARYGLVEDSRLGMVVEKLSQRSEREILSPLIAALHRIWQRDPERAVKSLLSVDIGSDAGLAAELSDVFCDQQDFELLTQDQTGALLKKLTRVIDIDRPQIATFLARASRALPEDVFDLFWSRIQLISSPPSDDFHALPAADLETEVELSFPPELQTKQLPLVLESMRTLPILVREWVPRLFWLVSGGIGPVGEQVLADALGSADADRLNDIITILSEVGRALHVNHGSLVDAIIARAGELGVEFHDEVTRRLQQIADNRAGAWSARLDPFDFEAQDDLE